MCLFLEICDGKSCTKVHAIEDLWGESEDEHFWLLAIATVDYESKKYDYEQKVIDKDNALLWLEEKEEELEKQARLLCAAEKRKKFFEDYK